MCVQLVLADEMNERVVLNFFESLRWPLGGRKDSPNILFVQKCKGSHENNYVTSFFGGAVKAMNNLSYLKQR